MRLHLFLLFLFVTIYSAVAQRQQPFEGIITYVVKTELKQPDHPNNKFFTQKYGDTLTIYYHKNGSERREYQNTGELGLDFSIYNKINNEEYTKWNGVNSIFYTSSSDTISRLDTLIAADTASILNKVCASIYVVTTDIFTGDKSRQTLYYSGDEYIPEHAYTKRKAGHHDKLFAKSKSRFLRWDEDFKYMYVTFEAISVERKSTDPNLFIVPNGLSKVKK